MMVLNRNLLFQGFIFRFHVGFRGCIPFLPGFRTIQTVVSQPPRRRVIEAGLGPTAKAGGELLNFGGGVSGPKKLCHEKFHVSNIL